MDIELVFQNLCNKDPRNPEFQILYGGDEESERPIPRDDCWCDNCTYGRDQLAVEILRLREKVLK